MSLSHQLRAFFVDSVFTGNRALSNGGVLSAENEVYVSVSGCTFQENEAERGGVFYFIQRINF